MNKRNKYITQIFAILLFFLIYIINLVYIFEGIKENLFVYITIIQLLLVYILFAKIKYGSFIIFIIPLYLSAIQNIILPLSYKYGNLDGIPLKTILIINYIFPLLFVIIKLFQKNEIIKNPEFKLLIMIILYSLSISLFNNFNFNSFFTYFRNITAPFIFFIFGLILSANINNLKPLKFGLYTLAAFIIIFGIYERFLYQEIWFEIGLPNYWLEKGLNIQHFGLPGNFYSSEKFNGEHIRRMVSSYADPINFGAVNFLIFLMSMHYRNYLLASICFIITFLIISKGGILGIFIYYYIYFTTKIKKSSILFLPLFTLILLANFIFFSSAGNSTLAHFNGLIKGLNSILTSPFGYGLGNVGKIASQFQDNELVELAIEESGFGVIAGQLGLPGLLLFSTFLLSIRARIADMDPKEASREKILLLTLLYFATANIIFNEVALSPNSSAGYFMILGMFLSKTSPRQILASSIRITSRITRPKR